MTAPAERMALRADDLDVTAVWARLLERSEELDWLDQDGLEALGYDVPPEDRPRVRAELLKYARGMVAGFQTGRHDDAAMSFDLARAFQVLRFLLRSP